MPNHDEDRTPLITAAKEREAERLAMVRSLTPERLGLSQRRGGRVIELLDKLSSESFSDGTTTCVRVSLLAARFSCNRSTIFRWLADAEACGLITSVRRWGTIGQEISAERSVNWDRVRDLVRGSDAVAEDICDTPVAIAIPPSQLRYPRRNCDTPVAIATPCSTYNSGSSESTDNNLRSGRADQNFRSTAKPGADTKATTAASRPRPVASIPADRLASRVAKLCRDIRVTHSDLWTLWLAIAAIDAGQLAASVIGRARDATANTKEPLDDPVRHFRTCLAEKANMDAKTLTATLSRVRIDWGTQKRGGMPRIDAAPITATTRRVEPPPQRNTNQSLVAALVAAEREHNANHTEVVR